MKMSSLKNIPVSEIENPERVKDDPKTNESIDKSSADDNSNSEIDAIQKHVEESLLFLDHDKATNIVSENADPNVESNTLIDPISKLKWEAPKLDQEKDENKLNTVNEHENEHSNGPLEPPVIASSQDTHNETSTSVEQASIVTDAPEKVDKDENNVNSELSQIASTQEKVEETSTAVTHEKTEVPQKIYAEVQSEPVQASTLEIIEERIQLVEVGQIETSISHAKEEKEEPSSMEENTEPEVLKPENINNVDVPTQEVIWESPLTEQPQGSEKMDEHIVIHETISKSLPLDQAQNETSKVSEKNDNPTEPQSAICSKNVEEIPHDLKNVSNIKKVTDTSKVETDENIISDNVHLESSKSTQEMKDIEKMVEDETKPHVESRNLQESVGGSPMTENDKDVEASSNTAEVEPTQVAAFKEEKHETMDEDPENMEPSEIIKQEIFEESTISKVEVKNETLGKVNLELPNIAIKQEKVEKNESENGKHIKPPQDIDKNIHKESTQIAAKQNINKGPILNQTQETYVLEEKEKLVYNVNSAYQGALKAIPKLTKKKPIYQCPKDSVIIHEKSAHSGSLKVVPIQDTITPLPQEIQKTPKNPLPQEIQKTPKNPLPQEIQKTPKNPLPQEIQKTPKNPLPQEIQKTPKNPLPQEIQKTPKNPLPQEIQKIPEKMTENVTYNTKSVHSGSLKVVSIQDNTECTPAKRARVEPTWSAVTETTDNVQSNSTKESATPIWSQNASVDDSEVWSPEPSDVSAQWETAQEPASNRSQSSCSSIIEDVPMDIDSGDADLHMPRQTSAHGDIDIMEFANWCEKHNICYTFRSDPKRMTYLKPLRYAVKHNKAVLQLGFIPKSLNQADIYQIIKKYTWNAGKEISKNIAFLYVDETSNPVFNTAYVKWRDREKYLTIKALTILRQAELTLEGRKLLIKYDDRSEVDWDANDNPIIKTKSVGPDQYVNTTQHLINTRNSFPHIPPFFKGEIEFRDKETYGLSWEFLNHFKLSPPLTCHVVVNNVKKDIRYENNHKIFSVAGNIQFLVLEPNETCQTLRIEYEHPLEAVQAISIFDQKAIYGQTVTVTMDKSAKPTQSTLPEGCTQLGPGLGTNGKPLKSVRVEVEIGVLRSTFNKAIIRLKQRVNASKFKVIDALNTQTQINQNIKQAKQTITEPFEETAQNSSTLQQNSQNTALQDSQNAIATLSSVISTSIQNNLLGMLGLQPNLLQGFAGLNQNNVVPNWSAPSTESYNWTQPNAQPNFTANFQMQPDFANMQSAQNMQSIPNIQTMQVPQNMQTTQNIQTMQVPQNMQTIQNIHVSPNVPVPGTMQCSPNVLAQQVPTQPPLIQPSHVNATGSKIQATNIQPVQYNPQTGSTASMIQPVQYNPQTGSTASMIQPVQYNPQTGSTASMTTPINTVLYDSNPPKYTSRFDIPPVVAKPQNRGQTQAYQIVTEKKPAPPPEPVKEILDIPLPVAKPQNRGPTAKAVFPSVKKAPVNKPPKPVGIKFNIPSLVSPKEIEIPPPVPKPQKRDKVPSTSQATKQTSTSQATKQTYKKVSPASPKAKSPVKELPWINKQIKAMRRSSKSPENSRNRSPRYDMFKEDRRSRESEYSREREREEEKEREMERDNRRPATLIFKYLPDSVSSDDLREKMREIGKLASAQVNGRGHAVVTFKYTKDAETCVEMYDKAKVDGQTIEVKWAK